MSWGCDIDGMLFEFFMNFLNIEKNKIIFFFNISCFLRVSCYFQQLKKKIPGGGGGWNFFLEKQFFLISRFVLFSTLKKYIEKCPFTYWLKWEVFLQIVEGQLESISIISSIPLY